MKYNYEVFLSPKILLNFEQLKGEEAENFLKSKGYHHIHVDDDGIVYALSVDNQYIDGWKVYRRRIPIFKTVSN